MPSPRAVLADITKFGLDPNKSHVIRKKHLVTNQNLNETIETVVSDAKEESTKELSTIKSITSPVEPDNNSSIEQKVEDVIEEVIPTVEKVEVVNPPSTVGYKKRTKKID